MTTINLDLDGVFFDFDRHYFELFGYQTKDEDDNILWYKIKDHGRFFETMPLFDGALEFLARIKNLVDDMNFYSRHIKPVAYDVVFLSACGKSDFENTARQKRKAVREHLDQNMHLIFSPAGRQKYLFLRKEGDILIDDFHKNLGPWMKQGGNAIHHTGDYDATFQTLKLALTKTVSNRTPEYDTSLSLTMEKAHVE
ncbi:HAD hydrolase-like domain-containing protein [Rhizobium phage RHph_I46]|uniref:HAD hydrolase-like domain-containing protein n=1 Tax=Rhizobium phage RHph_I1_9 TaxID=2509729 RepID=A0A7S5UY90_9CAUD|nr:5'-3' deoxyribonucleotidase [Rhizobium phage RHph_I1_9]QIG69793.1 HAD hydrolase-like domain-containing protein [Rhizobium phage RHph_I46]QIG71074.1 HAD hydrolase-like domain-containing protein [Rhizobium phage RHph_I9]QIG73659.1 HAD hydrolase-like domain-containing protein [Rhizobium phage RHph_I1_9]QIG76413.1 HAD hydrolase-like domain-containing protein [Rhizobium phage RHph_I34]